MNSLDEQEREARERMYTILCRQVKRKAADLSIPDESYRANPGQWDAFSNQLYDLKATIDSLFRFREG